MDKWDYIKFISKKDDKYGYLLLELMNKCNKNNLREITEQEVKEFYSEMIEKENKNE